MESQWHAVVLCRARSRRREYAEMGGGVHPGDEPYETIDVEGIAPYWEEVEGRFP